MAKYQHLRNPVITITLLFFMGYSCFSQVENPFLNKLKVIDEKIDFRDYKQAKILLSEVQATIDKLSTNDKYALDLRTAKVEHYANRNDKFINQILTNLDEISKEESSDLQYDYLTFIGQVFKGAKNFKKAIFFNKQALLNAQQRSDTLGIIFSCLKIGRNYYRIEYSDSTKLYNNKRDSALFYYKKALAFPENRKTNKYLTRIYDNLSRIEAKTGSLSLAEKYAIKALAINRQIDNHFGIAISLSNLSHIYFFKNNPEKAIEYAQESNDFIKNKSLSIRRDNLENIAKSYKLLNDNEKALIYLEAAAEISDKIAKRTLAKEINTIEATHNVNREQIKTLKEKNKRQLIFYSALIIIILLVTLGLLFYIRLRTYKKRFKKLITSIEKQPKKIFKKNSKLSGVPSEEIEEILKKLESFEKHNDFLTKSLTLNQVAERLKTNPTYLSKVINFYKDMSYTSFSNLARINYAIKRLKNDKKFQKYTINAIANESGFNSAESFSLAFRKKTGLYPSYFIKQIQKL